MNRVGLAASSNEVGDQLIECGAVKFPNQLSAESIGRLQQRVPTHIGLLLFKAPELQPVFDIFGLTEKSQPAPNIYTDHFRPASATTAPIHRDFYKMKGISFLIPYVGCDGTFVVSDDEFLADEPPKRLDTYGPRDVMVVRQTLYSVNNNPIHLDGAWHMDFAEQDREMIIIDWPQPNIIIRPEYLDGDCRVA